MNSDIAYNSNDLQTFDPSTGVGILTNVIDHTNIPDKVTDLYVIAQADASAITSINYPSKKINIAGAIVGSTQNDLDSRIDTFKSYFNGKNKNLDINYNGATRRYIATANTISVTRMQRAKYATFSIEFICTLPFGYETTATNITTQSNYTSPTLNATPTIAGSAPYQLPVFTITVDALTGDGDYIQLSNDNNGQSILVYGLGLEAGDVLVIDCVNRKVTLNDEVVEYTGTFLELEPGANSITYSDGFATRTVDIVGEYNKRYL